MLLQADRLWNAVAENAEAAADTAKATTGDLAAKLAKKDNKAVDNKAVDNKAAELAKKQNPLFAIFQPTQGNTLAVVGYANARDTAEVNKIIYSELANQILPAELKLRWGAKPEDFGGQNTKGDIFELYALKITEPSGRWKVMSSPALRMTSSQTQAVLAYLCR